MVLVYCIPLDIAVMSSLQRLHDAVSRYLIASRHWCDFHLFSVMFIRQIYIHYPLTFCSEKHITLYRYTFLGLNRQLVIRLERQFV